jgi:spore coat protein U-like protein
MRKILTMTAAAAVLASASAGYAANPAITSFQVSATVLKSCSVNATALAFPNYTPGGGAVTGTSTVSVSCTNGTTYTVLLNAGSTAGGTIAQRLMANGANTLEYNLYTTNTYATVFGDGTSSSATQGGTGAGVASTTAFTVYGNLPDSANNKAAVPGGPYTDTIGVTVNY